MLSTKFNRIIALLLAIVMIVSAVPAGVFAGGPELGTTETTHVNNPPEYVDGAVWVLIDSTECNKIVHSHGDSCYYYSCDHNNGHLSTCYGESVAYTLCTHADETEHTGSVNLTDVVEINGTNVSWKTDHPAYGVVYAIYREAYQSAYDSASFAKEYVAKAAGVAALVGKTFCYSTNMSDEPTLCTHGECSAVGGSCYTKICVLSEHEHVEDCYAYNWVLKSDLNRNGVADDVDTYYTVKYINDGVTIYEESILVGMPTPTVSNPSKNADAQYTYNFAGWDNPVAETVVANAVYTAVYNEVVNTYNVTWQNEDGTVLEIDSNVEYGVMPTYNSAIPEKASNGEEVYVFAGWTPSINAINGDVTYTATYTTKAIHTVDFYIDNVLVKTDYVISGEKLTAYAPTRAHYELTTWVLNGEPYDFNSAVSGDFELHAEWVLKESIVNVTAPNATYAVTNDGIVELNNGVIVNVTPNSGYAIVNVTVNGNVVSPVYSNGVAEIVFTTDDKTEIYNVVVETKVASLVLNNTTMNIYGNLNSESVFNKIYNSTNSVPGNLTASDVAVEYLAYKVTILGKEYEWWVTPETDVSLESFLNQYGLGSLASYIPAEHLPHSFGSQNVEDIRVTHNGNDQYPAMVATTTIVLADERIETVVHVNENINVTYGISENELLKLIFDKVTANGETIEVNMSDISLHATTLNAGTRKVSVSFAGNETYSASVAEVEVTILQAQSYVNVNSYAGKYGTSIKVSDMIDSNANNIEIVVGLELGDNASADAGSVVYINLPEFIDVDAIENEIVKKVLNKAMSVATDKMSGTMSVTELKDALNSILPYLNDIEEYGYAVNLTSQSIEGLVMVLEQIEKLDGIGDLKIKVAIGETMTIDNTGAYLVAGVVSDVNYTTSFGINYAVVVPDGLYAKLDWKVEDENGIITIDALKNGYDLSAYVSAVAEGNINDASAHLRTLFIGVDTNGKFIITQEQSDLTFGAYTEIAFLVDLGNKMYYAEPIARAFVVTTDIVVVDFIDDNGYVNNDRIFAYGQDATMRAVAFDRVTGEVITGGSMTYLYTGLQCDGMPYCSDVAPNKPGAYSVIALYVGENNTDIGTGVAAFVIEQKDSDFMLRDIEVKYDGNEHFVYIRDSVGLERVYIIVNGLGDVNILLPDDWDVPAIDAISTIKDLLQRINNLSVPTELSPYYSEFVSKLSDAISEVNKTVNIKSLTINGTLPINVGLYEVTGIAFGNSDYKIAVDDAILTILPETTEPDIGDDTDPTDPSEPSDGPTDPSNPDDKEDPTEPSDPGITDPDTPTDPSEPSNPSEPDDEHTTPGEEDKSDTPQTGDNTPVVLWMIMASLSLCAIVVLLFANKKKV